MDMKELAEMLEEELAQAFEVKNPRSLHRYVQLLTRNYVEAEPHERQFNELNGSIKEMLVSMQEGFRRMDERFAAQDQRFEERFAAQDRRFESLQKQMDERFAASQKQIDERFAAQERRFEEMNRRFDSQHRLISLGFTALALIIAAFNLALILG